MVSVSRGCVAIVSTAMLLAACGDSSGADDDHDDASESSSASESTSADVPVVDYAAQIQPIWNTWCTCHLQGPSGTMVAPTLTLNAEFSYQELVGTASMAVPTMSRIEPGDLEASYLWHKTHDTQLEVGGNGTEMPPGQVLSEPDFQVIEDWIRGGAMP